MDPTHDTSTSSSAERFLSAFKLGDYDEAIKVLPLLLEHRRDLATVTTVFQLNPSYRADSSLCSDVSLLHMAAYHGWLDIIKKTIKYFTYNCRDSRNQTPLHYAAYGGSSAVLVYLINEQRCDPEALGENGRIPLHYACAGGHIDIVKYLITKVCCNPEAKTNHGSLPLHFACLNGHLKIAKYLINEQKCSPRSRGRYGFTPLHWSSRSGHINIVRYLITEQGCDAAPPDNYGNLPLHFACVHGHFNIAKYLITEQNCSSTSPCERGYTPLHCASQGGHMKIIKYLIEQGCDPNLPQKDGILPLHLACLYGHLNVAKYLITERCCDPVSRGEHGYTPLHCAAQGGQVNIIQYLITELGCDPAEIDYNGRTVLHWASYCGHTQIVQWLLHNGQVDVKAKDNAGRTCVDLAGQRKNRYELLKLFQPLVVSTKKFQIHSFSKTVFTGNSAAGKTTLAKVIAERAASSFNRFRFGNVEQAEACSAGIIPSHIEGRKLGNILLYDLAGQAEYHSSHSAIMETVMQQSSAIFVNVVDLSSSETEIVQQLHYWLNFIDDATCKTTTESCVIVVGSHADLLSKNTLEEKSSLIASLVQKRVKRQENLGIITMDCRKIDTKATREFISLLHRGQQAIAARAPSMSYYCHLLYAFFQSNRINVCKLNELTSLLASDVSSIPSQVPVIELLETLNDKGMIVFLKNQHHLEDSWVVVDIGALLNDIHGTLFAPIGFKEYHVQVASNTGIVCSSSLKQLFPQHNLEMLVNVLEILELCHRVNLSGTSTNLQSIENLPSSSDVKKSLLFFPSLLDIQLPSSLHNKETFSFGWCLRCNSKAHHFFTSRFLHVLLLRLAYTFPLANENVSPYQRSCIIWTYGISWDNEEGIQTIVELVNQNQCVVVVMSHKACSRPVEYSKHRSAVISLLLDLKQQLCPQLNTAEYLVSRSLLRKWTINEVCLHDSDLFPIQNVARSMLLHKPYVLSCTNASSQLNCTEQMLLFEPYHQLSPFSVCELMDCSRDGDLVSQNLLHEVKTICKSHQLELQNHTSLRKCVDKMSIFAGRNPIVSLIIAFVQLL